MIETEAQDWSMEMNKEYIEKICTELEFPAEAVKEMLAAWEAVAAKADALNIWQKWIAAYERTGYGNEEEAGIDFKAALWEIDVAAQKAGIHRYTAELLFFLCLTQHLKRLYEERHIDLQIWHDSCMDLHWKLMECHKVYGIWGSFVAWWFSGFFELKLFALGRLQFELVDFPAAYEQIRGNRPEGMKKAVNVHIPSCGKLDLKDCHASYQKAALFFADAFPGEKVAFVCDSWLLFPPHQEMLGAESGIVKFMSEYDIYHTAESNGDLWRIFNRADTGDVGSLPEETSMQRAYKQRLLAGKKAGVGVGIFFLNKEGLHSGLFNELSDDSGVIS